MKTYLRKEARRHGSSLQILNETIERHADEMADKMAERLGDDETYTKLVDNKEKQDKKKDA